MEEKAQKPSGQKNTATGAIILNIIIISPKGASGRIRIIPKARGVAKIKQVRPLENSVFRLKVQTLKVSPHPSLWK